MQFLPEMSVCLLLYELSLAIYNILQSRWPDGKQTKPAQLTHCAYPGILKNSKHIFNICSVSANPMHLKYAWVELQLYKVVLFLSIMIPTDCPWFDSKFLHVFELNYCLLDDLVHSFLLQEVLGNQSKPRILYLYGRDG